MVTALSFPRECVVAEKWGCKSRDAQGYFINPRVGEWVQQSGASCTHSVCTIVTYMQKRCASREDREIPWEELPSGDTYCSLLLVEDRSLTQNEIEKNESRHSQSSLLWITSHQIEPVPIRDVKTEKGTEESGLKQTVVWKNQTSFLPSHLPCAALGHARRWNKACWARTCTEAFPGLN